MGMAQYRRDMFLIPRQVADKIYHRFGVAMLGEFVRLVDMYQRHWDIYGSGEGFDFSDYGDNVLVYFDIVQDKIDEKNREYFAKCDALVLNALKAAAKRKQAAARKIQKNNWYRQNAEATNEKRRQKYAARKLQQAGLDSRGHKFAAPLSGRDNDRSCADNDVKPVDNSLLSKVYGMDNEKKDVSAPLSSKMSSESSPAQADKGAAPKQPNRQQDYGYYGHKVLNKVLRHNGEGAVVDKSLCHNPTAGLSGHNLDGRGHKPPEAVGRKVVGRNPACRQEEVVRTSVDDLGPLPQARKPLAHNAPQPPRRQLPAGEPELGNKSVRQSQSGLTVWLPDSVIIGDDFKIDLTDEYFKPFARADKFLRCGFENWCVRELKGEKHDKKWLRKQLQKFAARQGKLKYLLE